MPQRALLHRHGQPDVGIAETPADDKLAVGAEMVLATFGRSFHVNPGGIGNRLTDGTWARRTTAIAASGPTPVTRFAMGESTLRAREIAASGALNGVAGI